MQVGYQFKPRPEPHKHKVLIPMGETCYSNLKVYAEEHSTSISDFVRQLIQQYGSFREEEIAKQKQLEVEPPQQTTPVPSA